MIIDTFGFFDELLEFAFLINLNMSTVIIIRLNVEGDSIAA